MIRKGVITLSVTVVLCVSHLASDSYGRNNILTTGLGASLDIDERNYETVVDNPATEVDESLVDLAEDDYQRIFITPMIQLQSTTARDNILIRFAPDLTYDLIDYDTDWNANARIAADRFVNRQWQIGASNLFLRSDYYDSSAVTAAEDGADPPLVDTGLTSDIGRTRYSRNDLNLFSEYLYREASLARVDLNYSILRYDDLRLGLEDNDRYEIILYNEHRFDARWNTDMDLRFIRGEFDTAVPEAGEAIIGAVVPGPGIPPTFADLSNDLKEYRFLLTVENTSNLQNPLSLSYYYIGTKYDEDLRNDSDIHQMRFSWRRDYNPRTYTVLGVGPSYEKTENRDGVWAGNGIAEFHTLRQRSSYHFVLEKMYDVENFDGTNQQGTVDFWDASFNMSYDISMNLSMTGRLSYRYEDREDPVAGVAAAIASDDPLSAIENGGIEELEEYHRDYYIAGIGFSYTFWQFYTANIEYTYTRQDSDRLVRDAYTDNRLLLTLSWEKDLFRW